jgi:hypothetical protein
MQENTVLVPANDHSYREARVRMTSVVWNARTRTYSEYVGDEYLEPGETVVQRPVAD